MAIREKKIAFAEHPLTQDEKYAITDKGYKIVDIRFAPKELPEGAKLFKKPKKKSEE